MKFVSHALFSLALTHAVSAQELSFSGSFENTLWLANGVPAALVEFDTGYLIAPRLSLSLDYQASPYFMLHATARADRGFDPGTAPDGDIRLDELSLLYRPFGDPSLNIQLGKTPTVVGNWVPSHHFYDDPFILAPLPYSAIVGVNLNNPADNSPAEIEARSNQKGASIHRKKDSWASIIWGPAYSNGLSVFGNKGKLDYAFEIKNAGLGAQPSEWDFGEGNFETPTISTRLGYRPDASWALGLSASHGHYLNENADRNLSPDVTRDDFTQMLLGLDIRWAHRDWIVSGEAFYTRYDTLHEDFQTLSYYLQARYKVSPGLWVAGRFGQTISNEVSIPSGGQESWSPDILRYELALGWRITPDMLFKTQYAYTQVTNDASEPTRDLVAISIGLKF